MNNAPLDLGAIDTVIFDFDGTIGHLNIDFSVIRQEIITLARSYGADVSGSQNRYTLEMIDHLKNDLISQGSSQVASFYREALAIVAAEELKSAQRGSLIPGSEEMLGKLKKQGFRLGVVTRNCYAAISLVLPAIEDYFGSAVITRERTVLFKPHPEHLLTALRVLGANPPSALMVGDHPMDILLGKTVGSLTAGVLTGQGNLSALQESGADIILNCAAEITELLGIQ